MPGAVNQPVDVRNLQAALTAQPECLVPWRLERAGEHDPHADAERQQEEAGDGLEGSSIHARGINPVLRASPKRSGRTQVAQAEWR